MSGSSPSDGPGPGPAAASGPPEWSRFGRGTVIPILLLVALLVILGQVHVDLAGGFTAPRLVADGARVFAFYDEGGRDAAFYFRESEDKGVTFGKRVRVADGVLSGAAITSDRLVTLSAQADGTGWFCGLYERATLARAWCADLSEPALELPNPRHLAVRERVVWVFGSDAQGALRAGRLAPDGRTVVAAPGAVLPGATVPPPDPAAKLAPGERRPAPPAPLALCSAPLLGAGGEPGPLVLLWRVLKDPQAARSTPGEVRWTTFDGAGFGELHALPFDLVAMTLVADGPRTLLFGARAATDDPTIAVWRLQPPAGPGAALGVEPEGAPVTYEREGLMGSQGVVGLSAVVAADRLLLAAQVGASIRLRARAADGTWGEWEDLAKMPAEQRAVVYGWGASLLLLAGWLVAQGGLALRARLRRPRAAPRDLAALCAQALEERARATNGLGGVPRGVTPPGGVPRVAAPGPPPAAGVQPAGLQPAGLQPAGVQPAGVRPAAVQASAAAADAELAEPAPLHERAMAFVVDLAALAGLGMGVHQAWPQLFERMDGDPRGALARWTIVAALGLAYFVVFEALFRCTPGKRLLGLEVQDQDGGRPTLTAILFRNLFRIELLLPPTWLLLGASALVMVMSAQHQRPGDVVARTVVRRRRLAASAG